MFSQFYPVYIHGCLCPLLQSRNAAAVGYSGERSSHGKVEQYEEVIVEERIVFDVERVERLAVNGYGGARLVPRKRVSVITAFPLEFILPDTILPFFHSAVSMSTDLPPSFPTFTCSGLYACSSSLVHPASWVSFVHTELSNVLKSSKNTTSSSVPVAAPLLSESSCPEAHAVNTAHINVRVRLTFLFIACLLLRL